MAQTKFTTTPTPIELTDKVNGLVDDIAGKAASSHNHSASNITSGTLAVARGGTGITANPSMLTDLGSTNAASVFATAPRPGVTGVLPIANGGTGATTAAGIRNALGLGNTTGAVPVANGGTGLTAAPSMLTNLGSTSAASLLQASPRPGVTGTLPIANGGTGATTAEQARVNLGVNDSIVGLSENGNTLTYTKKDGTTGTINMSKVMLKQW